MNTNFYVKSLVAILDTPLEIEAFIVPEADPVEYHSITSHLASSGQTVERFSNDGKFFIKAFNFTLKTIDEVRTKLVSYGLVEDVDFFLMNYDEVNIELASEQWINDTVSL